MSIARMPLGRCDPRQREAARSYVFCAFRAVPSAIGQEGPDVALHRRGGRGKLPDMTQNLTALMLVDRTGIVRFWNDVAERQFGYLAADVVGQKMDFFIVESHRDRHWGGFGAAMAAEMADLEQPVANAPVRHADGVVRYSPLRFVQIADPSGAPAGMLAVFGAPVEPGANGLYDLYPEVLEQNPA